MKIVLKRRCTLASLAAVAVSRAARADASVEQAARKEGALTWYVAQVVSETAEALARRFSAAHPGIEVAAIRTTGQVAYQRLLMELKNASPQCDILSTTDMSHMAMLKERKALLRYDPPNAAALLP